MNMLFGLVSIALIPLTALNLLGGIVSGIWLAVLGDWGSIGYGVLAMFFSSFLVSAAILPSIIFVGPAAHFSNKGLLSLFYMFAFLGSLYIVAVITAWCGAVLWFFANRATGDSYIPVLIWSYGVALAPWQWLAQKETQGGDGGSSAITTMFAQIGYLAMVLMATFGTFTFFEVLTAFVGIMLIGVVFQFAATTHSMRATSLHS